MFPLKIKSDVESITSEGFSSKHTKYGIFILVALVVFITPYLVNFEWNIETDSPGGNLNEFLATMDKPAGTANTLSIASPPDFVPPADEQPLPDVSDNGKPSGINNSVHKP